jgi:hypothetical protein
MGDTGFLEQILRIYEEARLSHDPERCMVAPHRTCASA